MADLSLLSLLLYLLPLLVLLHLWRSSLASKQKLLPPSPPGLPIIGNLHQLGSLPHHTLGALAQKHGPIMLIHLGQVPTLVVSSADTACEILKNHDQTFASRPPSKILQIVFERSIDMAFAPYGDYWKNARKLFVTHLLSKNMVQSFGRAREEEVSFLIDKISSRSGGVFNMSDVIYSFSNDVLCRLISGKFSRHNAVFRELIEELSDLIGTFNVEDFIPSLGWVDVFLGLKARVKRHSKRWDDVLEEVIKDHANRKRGDGSENDNFVDVLLSFQEDPNMDFRLTKDNIKALLLDTFSAGTDTSYIVLEWAMTELVRNSEVMKKLQNEVRGIVSGKAMVRAEDLNEMVYLKSVLKEVLRLHPPLPLLIQRESMEDCQIQGYKIPNKTRVIINAWATSRDPKFWEAPKEFHPERFVGSHVDFKGNDFNFIPFGAGRRICPGMNFGMATIELALANLVSKFEWELPNGLSKDDLDMTERPGLAIYRKQKLDLLAMPYTY